MRIVIFGLTVSSSWGNGHATLWRGLIRALGKRGHQVTFFEHDVPYYARHRDLERLEGGSLILYRDWDEAVPDARRAIENADVAMVTSYCPDARAATELVQKGSCTRCFYDMDTPVTLARLDRGDAVEYVPEDGFRRFDLVLSYTGGAALEALRTRLGARRAEALYGAIDPDEYVPGRPRPEFAASLSHLGTYAPDREAVLTRLLIDVARQRPDDRFLVAGPLYPPQFAWLPNVFYLPHVSPEQHRDFYASSAFTLNVTRGSMARLGFCPSGRLFEAGACESVVLTDVWAGLEQFFAPGAELIGVNTPEDVLATLSLPEHRRREIGRAARARVLREHTSAHRADELERLLAAAHRGRS